MKTFWYVLLIASVSQICTASDFSYGSLKQVHGDKDYKKDYTFLSLAAPAKKGQKFNYYSVKHNKIVCCVFAKEGPISADMLKSKFDIPDVWIDDITVASRGYDRRTFEPVVYLGSVDKEIIDQDDDFYFNGILIDESTKLGTQKGTLEFGGRIYRVKRKPWGLADGDGAMVEYSITDVSSAKPVEKPKRIITPFSTN